MAKSKGAGILSTMPYSGRVSNFKMQPMRNILKLAVPFPAYRLGLPHSIVAADTYRPGS
jgi:hypothetical protein